MASEANPPILAAPLEIRFEIYRHTWTIPFSDARELFEDIFGQWSSRSGLYPDICYFRVQVEQLHALVSICRQIRDEVLAEYFHQTQVGFCNRLTISSEVQQPTYLITHRIQSSLLFVSYTQHVHLYRTTGDIEPALMTRTLDWLLQLKQLKTLELIIDWPSYRMKSALNEVLESSLFGRLITLRNLEKIVVKLNGESSQETPVVQRIEDILSKSVREDLRQPEQQRTYVFQQLIGYEAFYAAWPVSYSI